MQQIYLLVHVMNLPFILVGDFNMPPASMQDSGWLSQLKAEILVPNVCSTLINSVCSLIDYAIVSYQLKSIIAFLEPDFSAPWRPHIGLMLGVHANVRSIEGVVQIIPKPLPLAEFQLCWSKFNDVQQLQAWRLAQGTA